MAVPTNIKTLLSGNIVEWARIEFKETWDAEASLKTICAFANDIDNWGGGYLVIGVREKNGCPDSLPGVPPEKIDRYLKDMLNKCKRIQPEYLPIVEVADYKGKKFIVIWAPGGYLRPYSSPKSMAKGEKERIPYIRKMSSTIAPSEEEKRELYNLANNVPFDDRVNHEADLTDLNLTLIQAYLKETGSSLYEESGHMDFLDLCQSMNIVNSLPEYTKPKNAGLMFFSLDPEKFFPYARIDVVQFPAGTGGDTIVENIFRGPLHQQLREALRYIQNSIIQERITKLPDKAEAVRVFNYPYAAVEESLCNAVYHKGYDVREPIEVRILPDRIEIVSYPGADRSITEEGLRTYRVFNRRYRNRRIGDFLKELHLTEGRNTGFRKILNALEQNGSPRPLFETDPERLSFCTTLFIHPKFLPQYMQENCRADITANGSEKITEEADNGVGINEGKDVNEGEGINEGKGVNEGEGINEGKGINESEGISKDEGVNEGEGVYAGGINRAPSSRGQFSEREQKVIHAMKCDPTISVSKIAKELHISLSTAERTVKSLKGKHLILREGSAKYGRWIVL